MKIILSALVLLIGLTSFSQTATTDQKSQAILDKLSVKMKSLKSFTIEFSTNIKNTASGVNDNLIGKGGVKGDKYYVSFGDNTIISNGIKSWTVVKEEKTVYEADAEEEDEESINPKKLLTIWEDGFKNKYIKEMTLNNEKVDVINLHPKNASDAEYHTIIVYISKSKNELKKVVMKMKDGTIMTHTMSKFVSNPTLADTKFVFNKAKFPGYTVIKD